MILSNSQVQFLEYLKDKLSISVEHEHGFYGEQYITVRLSLDNDEISSDMVSL